MTEYHLLSFRIQLKGFLVQCYIWKIWPETDEINNKKELAMVKLKQIVDTNVSFE